VGEASYAAFLTCADSWTTRPADANTYSLVATIDLARGEGKNPEVPSGSSLDTTTQSRHLPAIGLRELTVARKMEEIQSVLPSRDMKGAGLTKAVELVCPR